MEEIAKDLAVFEVEQAAFVAKMKILFNLTLEQSTIFGLFQLYDAVICDYYLGRKDLLPSKFTHEDFLQLRFVENYIFIYLL